MNAHKVLINKTKSHCCSRPDSSFIWVLSPLKSIRYILWHNYKWSIIKAGAFILLVLFFLLFVYSIPEYSVKRLLGA